MDPKNLRGTWLPKVAARGIERLRELIKTGQYFVSIGADETDDARPTNDYILTVDCVLIPKIKTADDDVAIQNFHLGLQFPDEVNSESMALTIDKVFLIP